MEILIILALIPFALGGLILLGIIVVPAIIFIATIIYLIFSKINNFINGIFSAIALVFGVLSDCLGMLNDALGRLFYPDEPSKTKN
jgi:hypothetical protein